MALENNKREEYGLHHFDGKPCTMCAEMTELEKKLLKCQVALAIIQGKVEGLSEGIVVRLKDIESRLEAIELSLPRKRKKT